MPSESPASDIVQRLADHTASRITRQTIRTLQAMKQPEVLQFGDDSGLTNIWEELCVQTQSQKSFAWDAYMTTVTAIVEGLVKELERYELEALWLATPQGEDWLFDDKEQRRPLGPVAEDVVQHLLDHHILRSAADWSNHRIRAYLDRT